MTVYTQKQFTAGIRCELWGLPAGVSLKANPELAFPIAESTFDALIAERTESLQAEIARANIEIEGLRTKARELEEQIESMNQRSQLAAAGKR